MAWGPTRQNVIHEEVKAIHAGLSVVTKNINNTKERSLTCRELWDSRPNSETFFSCKECLMRGTDAEPPGLWCAKPIDSLQLFSLAKWNSRYFFGICCVTGGTPAAHCDYSALNAKHQARLRVRPLYQKLLTGKVSKLAGWAAKYRDVVNLPRFQVRFTYQVPPGGPTASHRESSCNWPIPRIMAAMVDTLTFHQYNESVDEWINFLMNQWISGSLDAHINGRIIHWKN